MPLHCKGFSEERFQKKKMLSIYFDTPYEWMDSRILEKKHIGFEGMVNLEKVYA
jgi:hypothetical protein